MHVDASAMVAIILREPGYGALAARLAEASQRVTSAIAVLETIIAVGRELGDRSAGLQVLREFLASAKVDVAPVGAELVDGLANAHLRYGKGSGSPARLNLGDCFSYALAKRAGVPLLYKGDDFAQTDLA
ncbi:MAG: type II toxin-antitoxin system VapC family toxin [Rhizobiaceae bacterium]|nr:type II toxin-antitoxin system VapC family toxin [Rhizobiaceae bacterium]